MKIRNNLFLILFHSKNEDKWESWKRFAQKNNYSFSILSDPIERPIIRGVIKDKPICIEAVYLNNTDSDLYIRIQSPIHNPHELYFSIQDKKAYDAKNGIFMKSIHGICENLEFEERFLLKSNSEIFLMKLLNRNNLVNDLNSENNFSIEIANYELTLNVYRTNEIDKNFIQFLKLFYSFLLSFEETTIESYSYRK